MVLDQILERIEQARLSFGRHHIVQLVAVSKAVDTDAVAALYAQGQRAFGENRVQELERKSRLLADLPLAWHMIGRIQENKINKLIDLAPVLIHSIDSFKTAQAFHKRLELKNRFQFALLQINAAREASKQGVLPEEALELYERIRHECPRLLLQGVMTIGAHSDDQALIAKSFETTRRIFEQIGDASICSMGMSGDFELAIACGSTMVRIGSLLFSKF
ncbi:MAG: YggS family pyridoxal phosphate-dependent enzyme [Campylobacterales bacterium]